MGRAAAKPVALLKRLWRQNRWLTLSFLVTLMLALVFIIRAGIFFVYWQQHRDEPIQGWMTIRYIANSYRVEPRMVHDALGLQEKRPERRPLIRIAREEGRPLDALIESVLEAIEADRRARGAPDSDLPDPATSAPDTPSRP
jgi:hypothetical protein